MITRKRLFLLLSLLFSLIVPLYTLLVTWSNGYGSHTVYLYWGPPVQTLSIVMLVEFFMYNSDETWPKFRTILILTVLINLIFWGDLGIFIILSGGFLIVILHVICSYFIANIIKKAVYNMKEPGNIILINPPVKKALLAFLFIVTFLSLIWMSITGNNLHSTGSGWL